MLRCRLREDHRDDASPQRFGGQWRQVKRAGVRGNVAARGRGFCGGTERDFDATDKAGADRRRTFGLARLEPTRVLGAMRFEGDEVLARGVADGARWGCNDGSKM